MTPISYLWLSLFHRTSVWTHVPLSLLLSVPAVVMSRKVGHLEYPGGWLGEGEEGIGAPCKDLGTCKLCVIVG